MADAFLAQPVRRHPVLARQPLQKEIGQRQDVLAPLAQRREMDADDIEPVKQILAEAVGFHVAFEVAVGGGEDAHVGAQRLVAADA